MLYIMTLLTKWVIKLHVRFRWCPCFFFYLCGTIPGIWILELNRMDVYQERKEARNETLLQKAAQGLDDIQGVNTDTTYEAIHQYACIIVKKKLNCIYKCTSIYYK